MIRKGWLQIKDNRMEEGDMFFIGKGSNHYWADNETKRKKFKTLFFDIIITRISRDCGSGWRVSVNLQIKLIKFFQTKLTFKQNIPACKISNILNSYYKCCFLDSFKTARGIFV